MKKFIYFIAASSLFISCNNDDITFVPHNAVSTDIVLKTDDDFKNMVNAAYSYMIKNGGADGYGQEFLIDSEVMTDNVIVMRAGRLTNLDGYRLTSVPNNSHFDYFESAYRSAEMASRVITDINVLPAGSSRDNYEGQARFVRALDMFDMVRIYSKIPTQSSDANSSLGMYYLDNFEPNAQPVRPNVADTYQKILSDLLIAKDLIGTSNALTSGLASKSAVYALLSRVYLYMGDYPKVIQYGNLATANGSAAVCPRASFAGLWDDANSSGLLFKLRIDQVDGSTPGVAFSQTTAQGIKSEYVVPNDFMTMFASNDIRKTAYTVTSNYAGKTYNHIIKYNGRLTGNPNIVDIKVLRLEEVYLNMAEAQYRINGTGLQYLDMIRAQRYSSFVSPNETGVALFDAIMKERRLEFAFEMDRFFTLKRLNLPMQRLSTQGDYSNGTGTVPEATALTIPVGSFKWQLPIPQYYRDLNPNCDQNPGY